MSQEVLITGNNQLYNPLFCNLYPTNNGFVTCDNCTLSGPNNVLNHSNQGGYQDCLNACKSNGYCTSYNYNTSDGTCTQFKDFPTGLNNNVPNQSAGYNISSPFSFDYNNLSSEQKRNAKIKCGDQFLNNQYINDNNIEIASCISVSDSGTNSILNTDPACLYNIYKKNNLATNQVYTKSLIENDKYKLNATRDAKIDDYQLNYNEYIDSNVQKKNIDSLDSHTSSSIIDPNYNLLMQKTLEPILKTTSNVSSIINSKESFENKGKNVYNYNNYIILILILIIIFIIFSILFYNL
jgi:hypothetical protein